MAPPHSDEMVIHQHRLRRKQRQRKEAHNGLRDTYIPDHTQVLEGLLSEDMRAQIRNRDPKVSALPSKSEMKKRHLQRRAHERLHGSHQTSSVNGSNDGSGGGGSRLAVSNSEKRRQDFEQMQAADAGAAAAGGPMHATLNSTGTGLSGLMHVPSPDWRE
jgi:hypothetical protein